MKLLLTPSEIETLASAQDMTMTEACRRAGIAYSTFTRWRKGETEPTLSVYRRLCDAVGVSEAVCLPL